MNVLALLLLLAPTPAAAPETPPRPPFVLVLLDGRRLPLVRAPRWAFGRSTVEVAGGSRLALTWAQVDHAETARLNPELSAPAPSQVWTEKDLARLDDAPLTISGSSAGTSEEQAAEATEGELLLKPKAGLQGESEWRARAAPLRREIAQLEARLKQLERARDSWEAFTLGTGAYQAAAAQELGRIRRAREAAETRLQRARGDWARLEEDARTSGALPGWLR